MSQVGMRKELRPTYIFVPAAPPLFILKEFGVFHP